VAGAAQSLISGLVPPIANTQDVEFGDMNLVTQAPTEGNFNAGMCVAMGFGGMNSAILLLKTTDDDA
jgi:3-oxoacyl-(acyl-carrier-protein) synthase